MARTKTVQVFLTADEHAALKGRAAAAGMEASPYLRELGLGRQVRSQISREVTRDLVTLATKVPEGDIREALIRAARRLS